MEFTYGASSKSVPKLSTLGPKSWEKVIDLATQRRFSMKPRHAATYKATLTTVDNNETLAIGIDQAADGSYTALTLVDSKSGFKTRGGAVRWLARRGYNEDGSRIRKG